MGLPLERVYEEAMALSREERAELAQSLIESLDDGPGEDLGEVERAWADEIGRRVADLDAGRAETIPAEEVFAELRARFRR